MGRVSPLHAHQRTTHAALRFGLQCLSLLLVHVSLQLYAANVSQLCGHTQNGGNSCTSANRW
jgi:hypothetical protein